MVNLEKSNFHHSCDGGAGRKRNLKSTVLAAVSSPVKKILDSTDSSLTFQAAVSNSGLNVSQRQAQNFVRETRHTSWEQFVFELHHLRPFWLIYKRMI